MARIAQRKSSELAKPGENNKLKSAALLKINNNNKVDTLYTDLATFQLNPSSYEENKTTGWNSQQIPGQSNPTYQWSSGGARTITFEALVTKDHYHSGQNNSSPVDALAGKALNFVGNIASTFAGVSLPPVTDLFGQGPSPEEGRSLDISDHLSYYRSLTLPQYSEAHKSLQNSPPLVVLVNGRTFSSIFTEEVKTTGVVEEYMPLWFVENLNIKITKQLPNLDPMEARVTFTLTEYTIVPISSSNVLTDERTTVKTDIQSSLFDLSRIG